MSWSEIPVYAQTRLRPGTLWTPSVPPQRAACYRDARADCRRNLATGIQRGTIEEDLGRHDPRPTHNTFQTQLRSAPDSKPDRY